MVLTIGLQYGFKSFMWVTTVPPMLFIIAFKIWLDKMFYEKFMYYLPSETELREAKVHSSRADASGNRLEKRFGHPALHAELFAPMVHAKMMPLLGDVYKGKIGSDKAKLNEYGGQQMDAQVVEGGLRIAGIEQQDLEYDPALYQRDRGELDWDARSMASTAIFGHHHRDSSSAHHQKMHHYAGSMSGGRASPAPSAFERYAAKGASNSSSAIELSRLGQSVDHLPLLNDPGYIFTGGQNQPPLPGYSSPSRMTPPPRFASPAPLPPTRFASPAPMQYSPHRSPVEGYREAPLHRPYPPSRESSMGFSNGSPAPNLAGRDANRGGY